MKKPQRNEEKEEKRKTGRRIDEVYLYRIPGVHVTMAITSRMHTHICMCHAMTGAPQYGVWSTTHLIIHGPIYIYLCWPLNVFMYKTKRSFQIATETAPK